MTSACALTLIDCDLGHAVTRICDFNFRHVQSARSFLICAVGHTEASKNNFRAATKFRFVFEESRRFVSRRNFTLEVDQSDIARVESLSCTLFPVRGNRNAIYEEAYAFFA
ncbi:hypothetical protein D3C87_1790730 [compost metagenome]